MSVGPDCRWLLFGQRLRSSKFRQGRAASETQLWFREHLRLRLRSDMRLRLRSHVRLRLRSHMRRGLRRHTGLSLRCPHEARTSQTSLQNALPDDEPRLVPFS